MRYCLACSSAVMSLCALSSRYLDMLGAVGGALGNAASISECVHREQCKELYKLIAMYISTTVFFFLEYQHSIENNNVNTLMLSSIHHTYKCKH